MNDLVKALDRDKTTILRWEKQGLIPSARRDSRGWRYYTEDEFNFIVRKVDETKYFRKKVAAMVIALILFINAFALLPLSKFALSNANLNANLNVAAGTLSVTASSTVTAFGDVTYSFSAQTSSATNIESVRVQDARGGAGTWTFNLSCADSSTNCEWFGQTAKDRFQMNEEISSTTANGEYNASSSGVFCIDKTSGWRCVSSAGDTCSTVSVTSEYKCFPKSKLDLTLATGASANGDFYFAEGDLQQGVPARATASVFTTTLIYDLQ